MHHTMLAGTLLGDWRSVVKMLHPSTVTSKDFLSDVDFGADTL